LQFTSGDAAGAAATWESLRDGSEEDALSTFAAGLEALAADRFDEAIDLIRLGMAQNRDNPPLNNDMAMLIEAVRAETGAPGGGRSRGSIRCARLRRSTTATSGS